MKSYRSLERMPSRMDATIWLLTPSLPFCFLLSTDLKSLVMVGLSGTPGSTGGNLNID